MGQIDRMVLVSFSLGERVKHDSFSQAATLEDNLWSTLRNTETILVLFFWNCIDILLGEVYSRFPCPSHNPLPTAVIEQDRWEARG